MTLREAVLQALKEKAGEWLSGETLSESLNVSRTTVWNQIKALLAEGYEVDSSPKKGYRLSSPPDILSPEEVCPRLTCEVFGQTNYLYYQEIDSTNTRARALASAGYPEGTVVVADMQTAGRGRRGRSWYSPSGKGIYMSVILRPILPLKEISRISLLTAVAVAESLEEELNLSARIKWPNDILIKGKKVAGILSEVVTDMDGIEYIVVGIGLNINNELQDFPSDFRTIATSAHVEDARPVSRVKVLQGLLARLESRYFDLLAGSFEGILQKGKSLSVVIGQELRLDMINGFLMGKAVDIDDNGFLLLRDQSGVVHTIISGEITILPL
ncbi:biotin--[acetyl-CoA-carboxylase] ligase [Desulfosporosinus shakirovi]|uniref:biotin--[acetyl-CoA-carboxylase] ligase n=1 Tax=Desulfosporosinus shakirovi TaxID=2885154 RepID=UPI001E532B40|nr:biotin--[acetyl-CoA-carboxylase] ligase [Desulfosporosinus sp. SRJS8]MCB8817150.1 biotin--[acetyl-CoA-carboxylase] ligase [Desulfosporosinus sp. SRJS8]